MNAVTRVWGDGDCSGALNPVDSLKTLRFDAGLSAPKVDPTCPDFGNLVTIGATAGLTLLNEVLFTPGVGDDPFVELKTTGSGADPSGLLLVNERDDQFVIPDVGSIDGDDVLLLEFGGSDFLDSDSGSVELRDGDDVLDRVAWGEGFADGVNLSNGGVMSGPLPDGSSIGRPPGANTPDDRLEWTVYHDGPTTGSPNPNPEIAVLSPRDGARMDTSDVFVAWNPVVGASGYSVRVAPSLDLDAPALDVTVDRPGVTVEALSNGEYTWSVQPIGEAGDPAPASESRTFVVGDWPFQADPASVQGSEMLLDVEFIRSRKDTAMLLLEAEAAFKGLPGDHFWDAPHGGSDLADPADNTNDIEASVVMINAYLGGSASQDRLGYEVFKDRSPGPERDLSHGDAMTLARTQQMVAFAFGGFTQLCSDNDMEAQWEFIKGAIDDDLPLLAFSGGSNLPDPGDPPKITGRPQVTVEVITGYHVSDPGPGVELARFLGIHEAGLAGPYAVELRADMPDPFSCLWKPPDLPFGFTEEASVGVDTDGDDMVDFDEIMRFHTDPNEIDTDMDLITDKDEVFLSAFGLSPGNKPDLKGRDWDNDGSPMELDCDSDNDGIKDGEDEDLWSEPDVPDPSACDPIISFRSGPFGAIVSEDSLPCVLWPDDTCRAYVITFLVGWTGLTGPASVECGDSGRDQQTYDAPAPFGDRSFELFYGSWQWNFHPTVICVLLDGDGKQLDSVAAQVQV